MQNRIYLDNAATTPLLPEIIGEMQDAMQHTFGNPSSIHTYGREARVRIEKVRKKIAAYLHASPAEIFFTSGGTEANNMALYGAVYSLGVQHIITSAIEHHAVLHTAEVFEKRGNIQLHLVDLNERGHVSLTHLETLLQNYPNALVSLMHANNEISNLLSIKKVGELCRKYNAFFHSDMVQTMGHYPIDLPHLDVDFASCSAHKFHGPKGVGLLYINNERASIDPLIYGGAQERNMRGGTENIYGIAGMSKAFELAHDTMDEDAAYIAGLKKHCVQALEHEFEGVEFLGDSKEKGLYTVLNVVLPPELKIDPDMFLMNLDIEGIAVSSGSACASGTNERSHVLDIFTIPNDAVSVRISFSKLNTIQDIDHLISAIKQVIERNRNPL